MICMLYNTCYVIKYNTNYKYIYIYCLQLIQSFSQNNLKVILLFWDKNYVSLCRTLCFAQCHEQQSCCYSIYMLYLIKHMICYVI